MANDAYQLQGQNGGKVVGGGANTFAKATDNGGKAGRGFLVVNDAELAAYTGNLSNSVELVGITLPAGLYVPGSVDALETASGIVVVPF